MDGNNGHGYIQEDNSYDELMNGTGWSGPGDQFLYTQQPQEDLYSQFRPNQPAFDHYNVPPQQPTYPSLPYSNSPYAAQYQHARPSDVFGPTGNSNVDPSLQGSGQFQPLDRSFSGAPNATISPQYLQYGMASNQPASRPVSADFNRSANTMSPNNFNHQPGHPGLYFNNASQNLNVQQRSSSNLIPYPALPADHQNDSRPGIKRSMDGEPPLKALRMQQNREIQLPNPLRITHPELLAKRSTSTRPQMSYAPFVYFEDQSVQVPLGLKSQLISIFLPPHSTPFISVPVCFYTNANGVVDTLPKYHPRKARSGRELVPGFDMSRKYSPSASLLPREF